MQTEFSRAFELTGFHFHTGQGLWYKYQATYAISGSHVDWNASVSHEAQTSLTPNGRLEIADNPVELTASDAVRSEIKAYIDRIGR